MTTADIQLLIDESHEPRIEIGGPTPHGYSFLTELGLHLPDHFTVTNLANPIMLNPFGDTAEAYPVDEVIDIRTLPYSDSSVGMFLTSSLPLYGNHAREMKQAALVEYGNKDSLGIGILELYNLHIVFLRQAWRVLRPGGLVIFEHTRSQDSIIAQKLGFRTLIEPAIEQNIYGQIYLKPETTSHSHLNR